MAIGDVGQLDFDSAVQNAMDEVDEMMKVSRMRAKREVAAKLFELRAERDLLTQRIKVNPKSLAANSLRFTRDQIDLRLDTLRWVLGVERS